MWNLIDLGHTGYILRMMDPDRIFSASAQNGNKKSGFVLVGNISAIYEAFEYGSNS